MGNKTSIAELAALLTTPYSHLELGQVNDHAAYVMNFKDVYPFHRHVLDELYLVLEGEVTIRFKNSTLATTANPEEESLIKQLWPDQETYKREEQRRFEILLAHWDVPITDITPR